MLPPTYLEVPSGSGSILFKMHLKQDVTYITILCVAFPILKQFYDKRLCSQQLMLKYH